MLIVTSTRVYGALFLFQVSTSFVFELFQSTCIVASRSPLVLELKLVILSRIFFTFDYFFDYLSQY